jgi:hypothetical protein
MKEAQHKEKIVLCHDVLSVLNKIEPGMTLGRGLMLFELHSSLVMVSSLLILASRLSKTCIQANGKLGTLWVSFDIL